jgi:DHA1 family bicyclomycin/chloramphenicol resistance-like MFS transporter
MAGRIAGALQTRIGFACCGVAMAANVAYSAFSPSLEVPWAILPMMLNAFGIALVFPILTLAILDMYPRQRGSASSLQAFTGLVCNAVIAGLLSPLLSGSGLHLAAGSAVFAFLGWAIWRGEMRAGMRAPAGDPELAAALEPTDRC